MDILIPIETSSRELLYKVYLCRLLAENGFKCYLGRKSQINYLMNCLSDYIYLDKGYHCGESDLLYKIIKKNNGLIVSLDEEGGVDFADNSTLLSRYAKQFFSAVDFTFLWGFKQHDLIKSNLMDLSKVEITGHPRFEMLKPEYHYLYKNEVEKIKKDHGNFLLINTNMGFGNNINGDDFVSRNYGGRFKKIDQIISFDKEKLDCYIHLIKELSHNCNLNIVVRPHPEENQSVYQKAFGHIKNIKITNSGSVIPWLLAAQQMIHPDCTTAIESLFLGKQAYSFLPKNYPKNLVTHLPISSSAVFTDVDRLIDSIKNQQTEKTADNYDFVNSYFSIESQSFKIIVSRLVSIKKIRNKNCNSIFWRDWLWLRLKSLRSEFFPAEGQKLINNKLKGFNWANIYIINRDINSEINGRKINQQKVNLKNINNELFLFSSSKS
jgi:surface carbohydrate biosynthesis protein